MHTLRYYRWNLDCSKKGKSGGKVASTVIPDGKKRRGVFGSRAFSAENNASWLPHQLCRYTAAGPKYRTTNEVWVTEASLHELRVKLQ